MNLLKDPNKRKWVIVATMFIAIICNYLDRQLLSILKPEILTHFGIEDLQYAWIVNVFLICYAIMYPISGILVDRFGSKKVMLGGIVAWSLACIGGGLSTNVVEFTICRGILGLAEPTIFAGQIVAVTLWFEKRHRATANSLCTAGGSLGTVIAPLVIAWMARFLPWHDVFIVAGLVGLVIAVAWALIYKNPPQEVLAVTMAPDKDEVARNNGEQQRAFTWGELWTTRSLWGVLLIRLISDPVWYFCCFWLPGYLRSMGEAQGLSQQATLDMIQYIGGLPFLFGAVGGILTSVWSDWLVRRGMPALKARKTMMILMAFVAPLCILTPYVSEWQAVSFDARIGLVVAIFSLIAIMCLSWLYTICVVIAEAFPVKNVASVVGITAGAGAVGGAVFNIFIGSLLATMGNVLFAVMGVMLEAFCDLTDFDALAGFDTVQEVYAPWHALEEQSLSGRLLTNIFAGGTVDTEWGFLTGASEHDEYCGATGSYVRYFTAQGYAAHYAHPGYSWFYDRERVNDYLGFDRSVFTENGFGELVDPYVAMWHSDQQLADYLLADLDAADGSPLFSFAVSYQNHGPYAETESAVPYVSPEASGWSQGSCNILNNYLFGVNEAVREYVRLTQELDARDTPVVLVLFGDHKPWMGNGGSAYEEMGIDFDTSTLAGFRNYYATPYLIWANRAAKEVLGADFTGDGGDFSPCFLMTRLFDACGWTGPGYMQLSRDMRDISPLLHTNGLFLHDAVLTSVLSDTDSSFYRSWLAVQYYREHVAAYS